MHGTTSVSWVKDIMVTCNTGVPVQEKKWVHVKFGSSYDSLNHCFYFLPFTPKDMSSVMTFSDSVIKEFNGIEMCKS